MFDGLFSRDSKTDAAYRSPNLINESLGDRLAALNQSTLIHDGLVSGRPGYDYYNPTAFAAQQIRKPALAVPTLTGDTIEGVAANIAATGRLI